MFTKHVSQLDYFDIVDLINVRNEREGYHLDFKAEIGNPDKAKKELAKDITAFANTSGGFLILGVDKSYKITGLDSIIQNKSIDEWLNQILSSNIEPQVFYFDPKIIQIPESDKVLVIIHVPESTKKPHIVTEWNNYFVRINDSSKVANHNQIRDMFEFSKNRTDEFDKFLKKRNLLDEDTNEFGFNKNSISLYSDIPNVTNFPKPFVLFSLFTKYPNDEKIILPIPNFLKWLEDNSKGYKPCPEKSLFHASFDYDIKLDGIIMKVYKDKNLTSYFEILNNGYVEAGLSNSFIYFNGNDDQKIVFIELTKIIAYEMMFLHFACKIAELAKYYDEILFQISFVNVLNLNLTAFHDKYQGNLRRVTIDNGNKQHNNFKLHYRFNPKTITEDQIIMIAKQHSEKICRAFGLMTDYCFDNDKLSVSKMYDFHL
jgi:hypothetical protein